MSNPDDTYVDEHGVTWTSPTAFAYAKVCARMHEAEEEARRLARQLVAFEEASVEEPATTAAIFADPLAAIEGRDPLERLKYETLPVMLHPDTVKAWWHGVKARATAISGDWRPSYWRNLAERYRESLEHNADVVAAAREDTIRLDRAEFLLADGCNFLGLDGLGVQIEDAFGASSHYGTLRKLLDVCREPDHG